MYQLSYYHNSINHFDINYYSGYPFIKSYKFHRLKDVDHRTSPRCNMP